MSTIFTKQLFQTNSEINIINANVTNERKSNDGL